MRFSLFLLNRVVSMALVLFGVSVLIFAIARVIPGDPARIALGPLASAEQVERLRERLHLNEPLPVQYYEFLKGVFRGDLGISLYTNRAVVTDLVSFLPATLELVLVAGLLMVVIGVPLGVMAGRNRDGPVDNISRIVSLMGVVTPSFVWAIFLMLLFSFALGVLPVAGRISESVALPEPITGLILLDSLIRGHWSIFGDALAHIVLPALALAAAGIGQAARLTRANVAEAFNRQYVELARAFNFGELKLAAVYVLRPALIPTLTILGLDFAAMLGNAFLVEAVFGWPGVARYGVQAILHKDLNGIVGTVLVISMMFLMVNMVVDLTVAFLNPRIRLGAQTS